MTNYKAKSYQMNILLLSNKVPYPPKDGGAIAILNLARGFVADGNKVTILSMNTAKHHINIADIPFSLRNAINFKVVDVPATINMIAAARNLLFSKLPYSLERFISDKYLDELTKLLKSKNFDVVQLEGLYLSYCIDTIRNYSDALISLRAHNIEHEIWQRVAAGTHNIIKRVYLNNLAKRILKCKISILNKYDVLVPITDRDEMFFARLGNNKPAFVSQTGVFIDELKPATENCDYPSVFAIGALDWAPNQEGLLWFIKNVWPDVLQAFADLKFYVAGRNAPKWLEDILLDTNGLEYIGEVEDAHEFINSKAVMIVPLFSGSGMRIKIIEGMALQKCIITTSIGMEGIDGINAHNILVADDAKSFENAIFDVLNNSELFSRIGVNAREFISENFDNRLLSRQLLDFYKSQLLMRRQKGNE